MTERTHPNGRGAEIFQINREVFIGKLVVFGHFVHATRDFVLIVREKPWNPRGNS